LKKEYHLISFDQQNAPDEFKLSASLKRQSDSLTIVYKLKGPMTNLSLRTITGKPERRNGLWEETCFELFLMPTGSEAYWEFNLSPSGDWNVYRFNGYRLGIKEERGIGTLPFDVTILPGSLWLEVEIDLAKIIKSPSAIKAGISAVIKGVNEDRSYWALAHNGTRPDFHRADGFLIIL
jgi:hypothetical protein